jgi:hypothetical protein
MSPVFVNKTSHSLLCVGVLLLLFGCQPAPPAKNQDYAVQAAVPQTRLNLHQSLMGFANLTVAQRSISLLSDIIQSFPANIETPSVNTTEQFAPLDEQLALIYTTLTGDKTTASAELLELFEHPISDAVFGNIPPELYVENSDSGIVGYYFRHPDKRIYIIVNLSFDHHEVPFPLGFMTSTKVSIWQTDAPQFETFVTQRPLSIRPRTAIVVIV